MTEISDGEILDLVDENDKVVGTISRAENREKRTKKTRVVHCLIVNSEGKLWIPRRSADKKTYPLGLDFSASGYVSSGETYEEAIKREAQEELNLDVSKINIQEKAYLSPFKDNASRFIKFYEIRTDETPNYNHQDFTEAFWLTPAELNERINKGEPTKGDLKFLLKKFYL